MADIKLNFINNSNDANNSSVVIFQKNVATYDETAVAWKVIKSCCMGDNHPFTFPLDIEVGASDYYGNFTPNIPAQSGQSFEMVDTHSGQILRYFAKASTTKEIWVRNNLKIGPITAHVYRGGKLCALKSVIAPQQNAVFQFKPTIWIGVVSQIEEGDIIDTENVPEINTELNLLGIASADIVMTGGGSGKGAQPLAFSLQNIRMV